jgi:hypothetical protein
MNQLLGGELPICLSKGKTKILIFKNYLNVLAANVSKHIPFFGVEFIRRGIDFPGSPEYATYRWELRVIIQ